MCPLYTVGYEKTDISDFIDKLVANNIDTVIDVRYNPISRKKGFSKKSLENLLNTHKINYIHMKSLGSPKTLREELYTTKDYECFFQEYRLFICKNEYDDVVKATKIAEEYQSCLLCFEMKYRECHRSELANMICSISSKIDRVINL